MNGIMAVVKNGDPIEAAIAEAADLFKQRHGCPPAVVKIHSSNPANLFVDAQVERTKAVAPGHAWACGGEE